MSDTQVLTIQSRRQSKPLNIQPRGYETTSGSAKLLAQQKQRPIGQEKKKISQVLLNSGASPCVFCQNFSQNQPFSIMVGRALFSKYSASQNYYYSKDINELISNQRTPVVIRVKDTAAIDEEDEYLNRFYALREYDGKIVRLTEYYKFHRDIARLFMLPITTTLNKYHDKKRRIYYNQITKMLKEKEGKKDMPPPPQSSEKKRQQQNSNEDKEDHFQSFQLSQRVLPSFDDTEMEMKSLQSNTLQDLNSRLNDILLNSTQNTQSYFFENEASQTIGNLNSFLSHLQKQNSLSSQSSNPKPDFLSQNDMRHQFKQEEQLQQPSSINSRAVQNSYELPEQKLFISQKDSNIFTKKTASSQMFSSARNSLELIPKQIVTTQNDNQNKLQNGDKALEIRQMNQEMIALGILKQNSKVTQNTLPPFDKNQLGSNTRLQHVPSPVVSPLMVKDLSPLDKQADLQILFKKIPTNESQKEAKENSNPMAKEGAITLVTKDLLKVQNPFKMTVSEEATKLNSHNQSFEAIKTPLVIQNIKDNKLTQEPSSNQISNNKTNLHASNQDPPLSQSSSPTKRAPKIGSSQQRRQITSDKNIADANRKLNFPEINKISQENLSLQFKLHLQQRQTEEEITAPKRKHSSHEKTENKLNPYSALTAPNTDRPLQPKQNSLQSTLTSREKDEFPKSPVKMAYDKNTEKRLKTYEPIITRRENNIDFKVSLHRSKGDLFPPQQDTLGLTTDRQSILKTNEGKKQSLFNHLSSQGSLLSDEAMSPIKLQNKLSAQSDGAKSQTNLLPISNQIRSPTLESRVILDASPQKQSGSSLHISKSKTTFSTAVLSQSIPSNIKLNQVENQNNANNPEQRTTETLMRKTMKTKENKGSMSEIPELKMSQISSSQQNINPEITSQLNIQNSQGDTVPVRILSNQLSLKKSLPTNKYENLGELKQFYKEVQRRTEAAALHRDEELLQKGAMTQRVTSNAQQILNSKDISPRIQRLVKQENKIYDTNSQSSSTLKQVLTERDSSNRRNSKHFKSSSITSASSTNILSQGSTSRFSSPNGQIQIISNVQRAQEINNPNKINHLKQQTNKNSANTLKTTTSSFSNLETARKNQVTVVKSSLTEGSSGISPIPGHKQGSFTVLADHQLQQYGGGQTVTHNGNGQQQSSQIKMIDKIKHSRLNSMGSTTSIYPPVSSVSSIQTQPLQNKQMNQGYGQQPLQLSASHQQLQPQQFITNVDSQFSVGMPNNSNPKKILHKYTKSETDYSHQNSSHIQALASSQALNGGNQPINYSSQPAIPNLNIASQPQLPQSQSQLLETKRGMMSLHTQGSQPPSQGPQRGIGKKNSEQQQFVTYANNNVVNIYVNGQEGGTIILTNNIINNNNQNIHQSIGQVINSQINLNSNANMQQAPLHAFVPAKKQMNGGINKVQQDNVPSFQKI